MGIFGPRVQIALSHSHVEKRSLFQVKRIKQSTVHIFTVWVNQPPIRICYCLSGSDTSRTVTSITPHVHPFRKTPGTCAVLVFFLDVSRTFRDVWRLSGSLSRNRRAADSVALRSHFRWAMGETLFTSSTSRWPKTVGLYWDPILLWLPPMKNMLGWVYFHISDADCVLKRFSVQRLCQVCTLGACWLFTLVWPLSKFS